MLFDIFFWVFMAMAIVGLIVSCYMAWKTKEDRSSDDDWGNYP